jgi:hypothetical protein
MINHIWKRDYRENMYFVWDDTLPKVNKDIIMQKQSIWDWLCQICFIYCKIIIKVLVDAKIALHGIFWQLVEDNNTIKNDIVCPSSIYSSWLPCLVSSFFVLQERERSLPSISTEAITPQIWFTSLRSQTLFKICMVLYLCVFALVADASRVHPYL